MKKDIGILAFSGLLQIGGAIAIGYATSWIVGLCLIAVLWGHNVEKHQEYNAKFRGKQHLRFSGVLPCCMEKNNDEWPHFLLRF